MKESQDRNVVDRGHCGVRGSLTPSSWWPWQQSLTRLVSLLLRMQTCAKRHLLLPQNILCMTHEIWRQYKFGAIKMYKKLLRILGKETFIGNVDDTFCSKAIKQFWLTKVQLSVKWTFNNLSLVMYHHTTHRRRGKTDLSSRARVPRCLSSHPRCCPLLLRRPSSPNYRHRATAPTGKGYLKPPDSRAIVLTYDGYWNHPTVEL